MSKKTLKFHNIEDNKNETYTSKNQLLYTYQLKY